MAQSESDYSLPAPLRFKPEAKQQVTKLLEEWRDNEDVVLRKIDKNKVEHDIRTQIDRASTTKDLGDQLRSLVNGYYKENGADGLKIENFTSDLIQQAIRANNTPSESQERAR